jgi:hypothetical protein
MYSRTPIFRRSPRILIAQKSYAAITKEGVEFVRKRYSCSVVLDSGEIKLYGFLMRLLSFGGTLPLVLIKKWQESESLKKAQKNHYVTITASRRELPKREVQDVIEEIWGEIPRGAYV